ncbi:18S rRNA biogenesis protein RCL1 [Pichia kudriavzevii]|uniref:18S rRNA biogenesis protein RCL1 n=1 Tax=Pichia kudriavzevii TaxID=4909 RepID=A0A1Z8JSU8_PICKU|nr:18S rRNA biogenesis protein RCL1 [Pichia kudriavzevii]
MSGSKELTHFTTHENFTTRLVLATLSGKSIKISNIRSDSLNPGLVDSEISFLRLLESVTNGSIIEISYTGTSLIYRPGLITGGSFTHNCPDSKSVSYFIIPMLMLAPFSKKKFSIKHEVGLDFIKWGFIPLMQKFGIREVELHTLKRGSYPNGGGEVHLLVNSLIPQPITVHILDIQKISSIRGIAWCTRVSPSVVNRLVDASRSVLRQTGCEVNITTDVWRGENSGKSPGFGLTLFTESKKTPLRYIIDDVAVSGETPEDLADDLSYRFLELIENSGCAPRYLLDMAFIFMTIGKEDIGRFIVNKEQIDSELIQLLRDIKLLFNTEFYFQEDDDNDKALIATCKGIGFTNASKKIA